MLQQASDLDPVRYGTDDHRIGRALVRLESALEHQKGFGRATHCSTTTLIDGVRCRSEEGMCLIETDLPAGLGGTGAAPTPGVLLRAALGSCLAIGYRLRAARHGVALRSIRVVVETDSEVAGMLRTDSTARPGFGEVRYHVEIESDAPAEDVRAIVDEADRLSPILDAVGHPNHVSRSLSIVTRPGRHNQPKEQP